MWSQTRYVYRHVRRAVDYTGAVWTLIRVDVISVMSEVFAIELLSYVLEILNDVYKTLSHSLICC